MAASCFISRNSGYITLEYTTVPMDLLSCGYGMNLFQAGGLIMFTEVLYRKYTMSLKKAYFTLITVLARIKIPSSFVSGAGWWSLRKVHSYRSQIFSVAYLPSLWSWFWCDWKKRKPVQWFTYGRRFLRKLAHLSLPYSKDGKRGFAKFYSRKKKQHWHTWFNYGVGAMRLKL